MLKNVCTKKYEVGEGSYEIIVVYINSYSVLHFIQNALIVIEI